MKIFRRVFRHNIKSELQLRREARIRRYNESGGSLNQLNADLHNLDRMFNEDSR